MPTASLKLKPVDLCPKKPNPKILTVEGTVATVEVAVTTKSKPVPSVVLKRLEAKTVPPVMAMYAKIIQEETLVLEKKIKVLIDKGDIKAAEQMIADTQLSVRNATKGLQGAVNVAIEKQLKEDAKNDRDLLEAQVVVVLKGLFVTLKMSVAVARLAVSHGADVSAYVGLAKGAYEMYKLVAAALATEVKVRQQFSDAIDKYEKAVKAAQGSPDKKAKLDEALDKIRRDHKNKVTGLRQDLEKLSLRADELQKKAKASTALKNGPKLETKAQTMGKQVDVKLKDYLEVETIAQDLADRAKGAGVTPDNRTVMQRITLQDVKTFAGDLKTVITEIIDLAA